MKIYDLFNGDADGVCALIQLRRADPRPDAHLVTGVKRDINLFSQIDPQAGDQITALDISMRTNGKGLRQALKAGADVFYVDHHNAGDIPQSPNLKAVINTNPNVCTALLVDRSLAGASRAWAICGAYGDNLDQAAEDRADNMDIPLPQVRQLGRLLNYNAYGASLDDLLYAPADLYKILLPYETPMAFADDRPDIVNALQQRYDEDIKAARAARVLNESSSGRIFLMDDGASARRISGLFGNELARQAPDMAHGILTVQPGGYLVSVRAPKNRPKGADTLCLQFETGGGRAAAAGINHLDAQELDRFIASFRGQFMP